MLSKKEFKMMYENNTLKTVADYLGVSTGTVKNYAKRLGLSKGRGNRVNHKRKYSF